MIEVDFSSWGAYGTEAVDFERLSHAILEQYVVKFTYTSGKTERLERTVLPLKLVFKGAAWYLYGYCRLREDCRFFKLRRVRDLEVTQERFDLRAPERILTPDENMPKPLLPVKLKIAACMAFRVYDEMPQYTQDEHGDFLCELMLPDLPTICSYAASFGPYCVLLEPAAAADMLCEQMKKTLEQYRKYDTQMSYSTCYHKSIHKQKEGIIMNYEIVTLKEKTVLGITARTGNHDPQRSRPSATLAAVMGRALPVASK